MENLKIKVNNEAESKEVQELFFELGFTWSGNSTDIFEFATPEYIVNWDNGYITVGDDFSENRKEITLQELRDLVVLKRNDVGGATHKSGNHKYYLTGSEFYKYFNNKWVNVDEFVDGMSFELIEKPMKEYINKTTGEYRKTSEAVSGEQWIGIPDGAIKATMCNGFLIFWKDDCYSLSYKNGDTDFTFDENEDYGFNEYMSVNDDSVVVWQRPSHPETLPFIDDEKSLNDQYAEIEAVQKKHSHYKKDVSNLQFIDVYRVLSLFEVVDPCLQHAIKKLLCSGQRGVKSVDKDIQEAIDSLLRYQEMKKEDLK